MNIKDAFAKDNFIITGSCTINGKTGYVAESKTAINHLNGKPKKAYYIEGKATEMGYQIGYLGHEEVVQMVKEFPFAVISGFLDPAMPVEEKKIIVDAIMFILRASIYSFMDDIPFEYVQEAQGIVGGLYKADPSARNIKFEDIWVLNVGIDVLVAFMSNPGKLIEEIAATEEAKKHNFTPQEKHFRYPHFCNAYSAFGGAAANPNMHFFGRDWMLNGGDVLENCAALIVAKPSDKRKPIVYAGGPGLIGAALAMNNDGIAMGVDLVAAANGNPSKPGFNSIMLVRHCIHRSSSASEVVENMIKAQRGAPYIYPVSDGKNNRACIVEAGMSVENLDPLSYVADDLKPHLPNKAFLDANAERPVNGLVARWNDYKQPGIFMQNYNSGLFQYFKKKYDPAVWGEKGFVFTKPFFDDNAFGFYFFSPERIVKNDFIIATNSWISPPMNICSMSKFVNNANEKFWSDPQWRYDLINETLLDNYGKLDWETAWSTIDLLSPVNGVGPGKDYYLIDGSPWKLPVVKYKDAHGNEKSTWRVDGMTNLCELRTEKKVRSLYGTYADEWVEITLPNYLS